MLGSHDATRLARVFEFLRGLNRIFRLGLYLGWTGEDVHETIWSIKCEKIPAEALFERLFHHVRQFTLLLRDFEGNIVRVVWIVLFLHFVDFFLCESYLSITNEKLRGLMNCSFALLSHFVIFIHIFLDAMLHSSVILHLCHFSLVYHWHHHDIHALNRG